MTAWTALDIRTRGLLLLIFIFSSLILIPRISLEPGVNSASRLATVEALVDFGTFHIDQSRFKWTIDKISVDGHWLSSKPPVLSLYLAVIYTVLQAMSGHSFASAPEYLIFFLTLLGIMIPHFVLLFLGLKFLIRMNLSHWALVAAFATFSLNSLAAAYATTINNHSIAALLMMMSFYLAYGLRHAWFNGKIYWILCAISTALLPTVEMPGLFFSLFIFLYLLRFQAGNGLRVFIPAALLPILLHFYLNYLTTGSILPSYLRPELYQDNLYWKIRPGIDGLEEPKLAYFFHMLLGHHGFFSMTPIFLLGGWEMICRWKKTKVAFAEEAIGAGLAVLFTLLLLGFRTQNYGGLCVGYRWLIFMSPLFFVFTASWIRENFYKNSARLLWGLFFLMGFFNMLDASRQPWKTGKWDLAFQAAGLGSLAPHNHNVPDWLKNPAPAPRSIERTGP